eukprot:4824806-Karenia_brevis.AAC.1
MRSSGKTRCASWRLCGPVARGPFRACGCLPYASCEEHNTNRDDGWRRQHDRLWRDLEHSAGGHIDRNCYFRQAWSQGVDAQGEVRPQRERDLLNLRAAQAGSPEMPNPMVLDVSQSFGWDQFRMDGRVPTLATSSKIFALGLGRTLTSAELFDLMGFPPTYHLDQFDERTLRKFIGNTMHVAVVGVLLSVLVAMRSPHE